MKNYLSLIKFSHTIFAMPFALLGFFLAIKSGGGELSLRLLALVLLCMVFARSAAMAFNRYIDREFDAKNPRTAVREIPAGIISPKSALAFTIVNALLFIVTTYFINSACFQLSWVALLVVLGYSYTKRFTPFCHFVLGLGLALAPLGGFLAVTGKFDLVPILYAVAVFLWVSGFDIIYALQDEYFDQSHQLNSMPAYLGKEKALQLSKVLHLVCASAIAAATFFAAQYFAAIGWISALAVLAFWGLLFYQHRLVKPHDLSRVNLAFFTTNGIASIVCCGLLVLDLYI
ncbi:MAG: putative 4-hydroxybenzoate polyprenyltransferase [Saprospiraceae bacterium]|nr:putative 4-hydroxybenzoate polyprenyltransferase [Saprospiraceae bacterium]